MHGSTGRSGYPSDSSRRRWSWGRKAAHCPAGTWRRRTRRPHRSESGAAVSPHSDRWTAGPTGLRPIPHRPVGPDLQHRHGWPKLARPLPSASGTLVPASRGGPESDRFSRRLGPASHATRGGPESDRSPRRLGPESLASRGGPESVRYQQASGARVPRHRGGPESARTPSLSRNPATARGPGPGS